MSNKQININTSIKGEWADGMGSSEAPSVVPACDSNHHGDSGGSSKAHNVQTVLPGPIVPPNSNVLGVLDHTRFEVATYGPGPEKQQLAEAARNDGRVLVERLCDQTIASTLDTCALALSGGAHVTALIPRVQLSHECSLHRNLLPLHPQRGFIVIEGCDDPMGLIVELRANGYVLERMIPGEDKAATTQRLDKDHPYGQWIVLHSQSEGRIKCLPVGVSEACCFLRGQLKLSKGTALVVNRPWLSFGFSQVARDAQTSALVTRQVGRSTVIMHPGDDIAANLAVTRRLDRWFITRQVALGVAGQLFAMGLVVALLVVNMTGAFSSGTGVAASRVPYAFWLLATAAIPVLYSRMLDDQILLMRSAAGRIMAGEYWLSRYAVKARAAAAGVEHAAELVMLAWAGLRHHRDPMRARREKMKVLRGSPYPGLHIFGPPFGMLLAAAYLLPYGATVLLALAPSYAVSRCHEYTNSVFDPSEFQASLSKIGSNYTEMRLFFGSGALEPNWVVSTHLGSTQHARYPPMSANAWRNRNAGFMRVEPASDHMVHVAPIPMLISRVECKQISKDGHAIGYSQTAGELTLWPQDSNVGAICSFIVGTQDFPDGLTRIGDLDGYHVTAHVSEESELSHTWGSNIAAMAMTALASEGCNGPLARAFKNVIGEVVNALVDQNPAGATTILEGIIDRIVDAAQTPWFEDYYNTTSSGTYVSNRVRVCGINMAVFGGDGGPIIVALLLLLLSLCAHIIHAYGTDVHGWMMAERLSEPICSLRQRPDLTINGCMAEPAVLSASIGTLGSSTTNLAGGTTFGEEERWNGHYELEQVGQDMHTGAAPHVSFIIQALCGRRLGLHEAARRWFFGGKGAILVAGQLTDELGVYALSNRAHTVALARGCEMAGHGQTTESSRGTIHMEPANSNAWVSFVAPAWITAVITQAFRQIDHRSKALSLIVSGIAGKKVSLSCPPSMWGIGSLTKSWEAVKGRCG